VQHPVVEERVEVAGRVVAVERHLGVELLVDAPELGEVSGQEDRERRPLTDRDRGVRVAEQDADGLLTVEDLQDGEPLDELVDECRTVAEVGQDGDRTDVQVIRVEGIA
jgi:hypothetical protein